MDPLEKAFEESGYDLDLAIKKLTDLRLDSADQSACSVSHMQVTEETSNENLPKDGADWVEILVGEVMSASDIDDAKSRASTLLQVLETTILTRASSEAAQNFLQRSEALVEENNILRQAVVVQYERQKGFRNAKTELANLKKLLKNYALSLQLKQALNGKSTPGHGF